MNDVGTEGRRPLYSAAGRMKLRSWALLLAVVVAVGGISYSLLSSNARLTPQQRITQIESEVKCPSCDGISALDSNTAGAFAVRSFVQKQVKAGKSDKQIIDALQASYGPNILMAPPPGYGGRIIDLMPFAFLAIVLAAIGFYGYKRMRGIKTSQSAMQGEAEIASPVVDVEPSVSPALAVFHTESVDTERLSMEQDPELPGIKAVASGIKGLRSVRKAWVFYVGVLLLVGGAASGFFLIRSQDNANRQLAAAALQAQNEAQAILQARVLANEGQDVQALKLLSSVLKVDPNQPVALAYQGWLLAQAGEKDKSDPLVNQGMQFLQQSVKLDPSYPDARLFLGLVLFQYRHDAKDAVVQFNAFLADKPNSSFVNATKSVLVSAYKDAGQPVPSQLG